MFQPQNIALSFTALSRLKLLGEVSIFTSQITAEFVANQLSYTIASVTSDYTRRYRSDVFQH